jgi:aminoglycoside phosphotransferase (APT) family kinase protein
MAVMTASDTSPTAARRLLREHCPQWADLPLTRIVSSGMDNAIYRLGPDLVLRLPQTPHAAERFAAELGWLPVVARRLRVRVPRVRYAGAPSAGLSSGWAVLDWIDGDDAWTSAEVDGAGLAEDLAAVVAALRSADVRADGLDPPVGARGGPLAPREERISEAIADVGHLVDATVALRIWRRALAAAPHPGPPVLLHADLIPGNLVIEGGRLAGVIDWGTISSGDPSCDLTPAWWVLDGVSRAHFRAALGDDDDAWQRAAGWALAQAALATRHYLPVGHALGEVGLRALRELVADPAVGGTAPTADSTP